MYLDDLSCCNLMLNDSENLGLVDMELSSGTQQSRISKVMTVDGR